MKRSIEPWTITTPNHITSSIFSVSGHDLAIHFYPDDGSFVHDDTGSSTQPYISIFLVLLSKEGKIRASCGLSLVDQATGMPSQTAGRRTPELTEFSYDNPSMIRSHRFL